MTKLKFFAIVLVFFSFLVINFLYINSTKPENIEKIAKTHKLKLDKLEIAKTRDEQQIGLMKRTEMCEKCGMLFVFENSDYLNFWMKNTLISLDIIFINENQEIVKIHPKTQINQTEILYPSEQKAKWVLEVPSDFCEKNDIKEKDFLDIDYLQQNSKLD
jgi:uncharacterized membrane protein (UPF0127 family)